MDIMYRRQSNMSYCGTFNLFISLINILVYVLWYIIIILYSRFDCAKLKSADWGVSVLLLCFCCM